MDATHEDEKQQLLLLVIAASENYHNVFEQVKEEYSDHLIFKHYDIVVEQAGFDDIQVMNYYDSGLIVELQPSIKPLPNTKQNKHRTVKPNFVLVRNVVHGAYRLDYRNVLYGLIHAGIGSVNSLESMFFCLERSVVHGELKKIERELGHDQFPLIPQSYYSNCRDLNFVPPYPVILKVAHVHAGLGKMKLENDAQLQDVKSIMAVHGTDYSTAEPYLSGEYDIRIQKIGDHYRAFKRVNLHGWKGNVGTAVIEDIPMTTRYKLWADKASQMFGGMDILAVDVLVEQGTGKEYILEVNDSSIGLGPEHADHDNIIMGKLVLDKMWQRFNPENNKDTMETVNTERDGQDPSVQLVNTRNELIEAQLKINRLEKLNQELDQKYKNAYNYAINMKKKEWKRMAAWTSGVALTGLAVAFVTKYFWEI